MNAIVVSMLNATPERPKKAHWIGRCVTAFAGLVLLAVVFGLVV